MRTHVGTCLAVLSCLLLLALPALDVAASGGYAVVSKLPHGGFVLAGCYDADHDGLNELYIDWDMLRIYEYRGDFQYVQIDTMDNVGFWAVGDIDKDGLADLVVQDETHVMVYESKRADSLDWQEVWQWQTPATGLAAATYITDGDRDGKSELFITQGTILRCFEAQGQNAYNEVWRDSILPPLLDVAYFSFGDFDSDRKTELMTSTEGGWYCVFENSDSAVDNYPMVRVDSITHVYDSWYNASSPDMDGDGKPEFMITGNTRGPGGWAWQLDVLEADGDNSYHTVWVDSVTGCPYLSTAWISCGDVDGDGVNEILFGISKKGLFLYKATGVHQWTQIWDYPVSSGTNISSVLVYDINRNGYAEMVMVCFDSTFIFEKEGVGVGGWEKERFGAPVLLNQNSPNPFTKETVLEYEVRKSCGVDLAIYGIAGRRVRTLVSGVVAVGRHTVSWDGGDDAGRILPSGVYFATLRAGGTLTTRKMIMVR